jgi:DNA polymerase-3 subunit delta'
MSIINHALAESFFSQGEEFRTLFRQLETRTHVHAYLITGEKGTGKRTLARAMCASLLCSSEESRPCGICRNCLLVEKSEHPDVILIDQNGTASSASRKERSTIPVNDIREMIRLSGTRSPEGNTKVALIFDADRMTPQAQNCLLKTLEEPVSDLCMILVTDHIESILSTVISRCRIIRMKAWSNDYLFSVLKREGVSGDMASRAVSEANGSIGEALRLSSDDAYWAEREELLESFFRASARSDILAFSNRWKDHKADSDQLLSILESLILRLYEARFNPEKNLDLSEFPEKWQRFSRFASVGQFAALSEAVSDARKQLQFSTNFQAVLEKLLFIFMGEGNKWLQ